MQEVVLHRVKNTKTCKKCRLTEKQGHSFVTRCDQNILRLCLSINIHRTVHYEFAWMSRQRSTVKFRGKIFGANDLNVMANR